MDVKRCYITVLVWLLTATWAGTSLAEDLPAASATPAIGLPHFPDRAHAFVWRNWELVGLERMAEVLGTTVDNVREAGQSMGLPPHVPPPPAYRQRGYISIIRRNWHILPYEQLLTLLGWDAERLAFTLREDDFLWVKLGGLKPLCPPVHYSEPNEAVRARRREIRSTVSSHFAAEFDKPYRPRFDFLPDITSAGLSGVKDEAIGDTERPIRFLYSYFGVFGDPLSDTELDPYPEALLQRLAELGVNGVWLHVVLRQLAPNPSFADWAQGQEGRITRLREMVDRAGRHGISIYLYMNEPRAMPVSFFEQRPDIRGVRSGDYCTLCTSTPQVRQWMYDALEYVFERVPGLGGVFTITASENLTNCYSHSRDAAGCPRCSQRSGPEVIAEVNKTIAAGVWAGNPKAKVIIWDWGWPDGTATGWGAPDWTGPIIEQLPQGVYLMCVSEWGKPIQRGGVAAAVGEYSISAVGPGPRAARHWALAQKRGLKTLAKVQVNCTWELSAVPYLPVMNLVAEHCANLAQADVDGLMLSWTVGGYPSPNLQLVSQFNSRPAPSPQEALVRTARDRYGEKAAEQALAAWSLFSRAFTEYPFDISFVYRGPAQYGPVNLLYPEPTGYQSTMVGFPYDDVDGWRGVYPADVLAGQFEKMARHWEQGLRRYEQALARADSADYEAGIRTDMALATAAWLHFDSVANQIRFFQTRDALASASLSQADRDRKSEQIEAIIAREIDNARRLFTLTRRDPRIGFEASNHYYYLPLDLVEKVVHCRYILDTRRRRH